MGRQLERLVTLQPGQMLAYRPFTALLLWLRLWKFVGLSRSAEIVCLHSPRQFRFLKLLALALRGRLTISDGNGNLIASALPLVTTSDGNFRPTSLYSYDSNNNLIAGCDPHFGLRASRCHR